MAQLSQSKERKKRREERRKISSKTLPDGRAALLCLWPYTTLSLAYSTPTIGLLLFWEPVTSWCQNSTFAFLPGRPFLQRSLRLSPLPSPDAHVTSSEWGLWPPNFTNCLQLTSDILSPSLHFSFSVSLSIIWHAAYFLIYVLTFCPNPLECKIYKDRDFCESYLLLYPQKLLLISLTIEFSLWTVIGMTCFSNI